MQAVEEQLRMHFSKATYRLSPSACFSHHISRYMYKEQAQFLLEVHHRPSGVAKRPVPPPAGCSVALTDGHQ